jgi:hypothetical protein
VNTFAVRRRIDTEAEAQLVGRFLDDTDYDRLVRDDTTVLKPDGTPLLVYVRNALPHDVVRSAADVLRTVRPESKNRGAAAGSSRYRERKLDGSQSRTTVADPLPSGLMGFYDRSPRQPYCRATAFTARHHRKFTQLRPFVSAVNGVFERYAPDRYRAQAEMVGRCDPAWVIPGSVFTTLTVNRTLRTACPRDQGDYAPGFGVVSVIEVGAFAGGHLVFPSYRVAVDLRSGGVLLADVHELHGNTPIVGEPDRFLRLSTVFYARSKMVACGSPADELARAKQRE